MGLADNVHHKHRTLAALIALRYRVLYRLNTMECGTRLIAVDGPKVMPPSSVDNWDTQKPSQIQHLFNFWAAMAVVVLVLGCLTILPVSGMKMTSRHAGSLAGRPQGL